MNEVKRNTLTGRKFFLLAAQVAMHPEKLTECLGKCLTPILLTLIVIVFGASVLHPAGPAAAPGGVYGSAAAVSGFLDGYQTMDTLAALNPNRLWVRKLLKGKAVK